MSNQPSDNGGSHSQPGRQPDWEAIARYLANESSADEAEQVRRWLEANPADRSLVARLDEAVTIEPAPIDVEAALAKVHAEMIAPERPRLVVERGGAARTAPRKPRTIVMIAGVAVAAAAVFVAFRLGQRTTTAPAGSPSVHTYATAVGKRDSVNLPDGSRVILGPDSRLTVRGDYGSSSRAVELVGDAYFDVKHDAAKPFRVRVGQALIEDIGTSFVVESDAGDTTSVAVVTGSVRLRPSSGADTAGQVLSAGDRGSMSVDGKVHAYPHTLADDVSWTTGRVVFKDASVARVVGEIHRWFGVELRVSDTALLSRHVSTSFDGDEPVDQVLKILSLTLGATMERHGDTATLSAVR